MIDVVIRAAAADDDDQVRSVESEARNALVGMRGGQRWLEEHPPLEMSDADPRQILVAAIDDVIVGYLALAIGPRIAIVDQVFVTPEARGIGIGDSLLEEAIHRATAAGAEFLEAIALPGDRDTKNLYERAGIVARSITVSTRLTGEVSGRATPDHASRRTP